MIVIGIDPGASGGIAFLTDREHRTLDEPFLPSEPRLFKMPETDTDLAELFERQLENIHGVDGGPTMVYVEKVHSFPEQGVSSTFKFGVNYGTIRGVLAALKLPREFIAPQTWQKALCCLSRGDKNVTKRKAQELFPRARVIHAVADALLIAEYGRRAIAGRSAPPIPELAAGVYGDPPF